MQFEYSLKRDNITVTNRVFNALSLSWNLFNQKWYIDKSEIQGFTLVLFAHQDEHNVHNALKMNEHCTVYIYSRQWDKRWFLFINKQNTQTMCSQGEK